ncbi:RCC1 domain-containing protein [Streptomyces lavendulae]|uniref:RCC1 domain-containing protein n=1 Tax=Streptomyces lavendulae TaxID=1914 RepID=UPI003800C050
MSIASLPHAPSAGPVVGWGYDNYGQSDVPEGLTAVQIATGLEHSLALREDGTVTVWGGNRFGQTEIPEGLTGIVQVASGGRHSLVLRADGTVSAWGNNAYGETDVPVGLTDVVQVSAGLCVSLALRKDGTVIAWGGEFHGQTDVPEGLSAVQISTGREHSMALRQDGTVIAWGNNYSRPVPDGLCDIVQVAAGDGHSLALRKDGTVIAWGWNRDGQTDVPDGLGEIVQVAAGDGQSLALRKDGTVIAWGNDYGRPVPEGLRASTLASGYLHSLAIESSPDRARRLEAQSGDGQSRRAGKTFRACRVRVTRPDGSAGADTPVTFQLQGTYAAFDDCSTQSPTTATVETGPDGTCGSPPITSYAGATGIIHVKASAGPDTVYFALTVRKNS